MTSIDKVADAYTDKIESVESWCNQLYAEKFEVHFAGFRDVFKRLRSKGSKITDDELEELLITLPIKLFDASESLSVVRIASETVKIGSRLKETEIIEAEKGSGTKTTAAKEIAAASVLEDRLLIIAYESIISRVESEISFCRELIMSAKKIWDSRRKTDTANPVSEVDDLPEYVPNPKKTYVKGV